MNNSVVLTAEEYDIMYIINELEQSIQNHRNTAKLIIT